MSADAFHHRVFAIADRDASSAFCARVLDKKAVTFGEGLTALGFGVQKLNLYRRGRAFALSADRSTPGVIDARFIIRLPVA